MISIVTPNYNCERWVGDCLDSVANQTSGQDDIEMILVDDGSTDNSREIIEEYRENIPGLRTIWHEHIGKPSALRNLALDRAKGDYVLFLDSDDFLGPDAVKRLVSFTKVEQSDVVAFQLEGLNRSVPKSMLQTTGHDVDLVGSGIYKSLGIWKMCNRDFLDRRRIRFDSTLPSGDDIPFIAEALLKARKVSVISDYPFYTVRGREDGSSLTQVEWAHQERMKVGKQLGELSCAYAASDNIKNHFLIRLFNTDALAIIDSPTADQGTLEALKAEYGRYWSLEVADLIYTDAAREKLINFFGTGALDD